MSISNKPMQYNGYHHERLSLAMIFFKKKFHLDNNYFIWMDPYFNCVAKRISFWRWNSILIEILFTSTQSQSPSLKTNYEIKNPKRDYIEQSLQIQESHNTKKMIFFDSKTQSHVIQVWDENLALIPIVGKSGFVSHTKHIAEATNMDLFHSWLVTWIM